MLKFVSQRWQYHSTECYSGPKHYWEIICVPLKEEYMKGEFIEGKLADSLPCHVEPPSIEMLIGNNYSFDLLEPRKVVVYSCFTLSLVGFLVEELSKILTTIMNLVY